ncbi:MAG: DNA polymerase I [Burkholderiaceae bacterium]
MKRLLLVDGSSYLYRAFHAMPDLRNRAGEPTGAIYGMVNMLRRFRSDYTKPGKPELLADCMVCVFDAPGKTFRDALYADYKANRSAMPDDLARQIPAIHELVPALGWPMLMVEGVEADDVIGTLACQAVAQGFGEVVVSTGDKDLAQLVNPQVRLVNTMSNEVLDEAGVFNKFGVRPDQIVDYLTLIGDSVDNIPGVPKVGPKTAAKWLAQYGTLDALVAAAAAIGGAVGNNLRASLAWLPQGKALITVKCDCDLSAQVRDIETDLHARSEDADLLREMYRRFEFKTWFQALGGVDADPAAGLPATGGQLPDGALPPGAQSSLFEAAPSTASTIETVCVDTWEAFDGLLADIQTAELVALDTETTALDPMLARLVGLAFCARPGKAYYLPLAHCGPDAPAQLPLADVLTRLKPWFEDAARLKLAQHAKYDQHVLLNEGVAIAGLVHDTMLQSYVLEAHKPCNMDALALRWLNHKTITYDEVTGKGAARIGFDEVAVAVATRYSAEDAEVTLRLHEVLYPQLQGPLLDIYRTIEMPTSAVLCHVERNGVLLDVEKLRVQSVELAKRVLEIEQEAYALAGQPFNLGSPKQVGEILFDKLGLPIVKKTANGAPSTDESVLSILAENYPLPARLLEHRSLAKLRSTYTDKLPKMINPATGRVHTNYAQSVVVTGRLSSNEPNLQNIPVRTAEGRRIREAFIAAPGAMIVSADYSQIELRIMAHISGDEALTHAFAAGEDVHRATAAEIFGVAPAEVGDDQRRTAKIINFGLIYGMSSFGLAKSLNIGRDAAKLYIDRYFMRYPKVAKYMEQTRTQAKALGFVETVFGRRLWLPEINSPNGPRRAGAERAAINAPMQGTAADLLKLAMIATDRWLIQEKLRSRMIMQVHDEVVLEVPEAELEAVRAALPGLMTGVARLAVPLEVSVGVGLNWDEAH